ncbi:dymeclin-like [Pitangus sulphuratus]|nr:dymeclin-like [Pitangus sulphuratus]
MERQGKGDGFLLPEGRVRIARAWMEEEMKVKVWPGDELWISWPKGAPGELERDWGQGMEGEDMGEWLPASRGQAEAQDLNVIEEVIRMMLEIINSCLTNSLHHNPNLVYALLYKRDLFEQFRTHPSFQDIMQNIDLVISFFSSRLEQAGAELSVERVLEIIKQGAVALPKDRLRKFPELKFKYVEEEQPEEFFIPYVWSLVYNSAVALYWNPHDIQLFTMDSG